MVSGKILEFDERNENIDENNIKKLYGEYISGTLANKEKYLFFAIPIIITVMLLFMQSDFHEIIAGKPLIMICSYSVISMILSTVCFFLTVKIDRKSIEHFLLNIKSWATNGD